MLPALLIRCRYNRKPNLRWSLAANFQPWLSMCLTCGSNGPPFRHLIMPLLLPLLPRAGFNPTRSVAGASCGHVAPAPPARLPGAPCACLAPDLGSGARAARDDPGSLWQGHAVSLERHPLRTRLPRLDQLDPFAEVRTGMAEACGTSECTDRGSARWQRLHARIHPPAAPSPSGEGVGEEGPRHCGTCCVCWNSAAPHPNPSPRGEGLTPAGHLTLPPTRKPIFPAKRRHGRRRCWQQPPAPSCPRRRPR